MGKGAGEVRARVRVKVRVKVRVSVRNQLLLPSSKQPQHSLLSFPIKKYAP